MTITSFFLNVVLRCQLP